MKIIVLNGSPKGPVSVTMQYVGYIASRHPEHELKVLHVAQRIHGLEKDPERFDEIVEEIRSADGVLWAFPLYFLLVSSQYKRFIELIFNGINHSMSIYNIAYITRLMRAYTKKF